MCVKYVGYVKCTCFGHVFAFLVQNANAYIDTRAESIDPSSSSMVLDSSDATGRRAMSKDLDPSPLSPRSLGSPRPTRLLELLPVAPWCGQCLPQAPDGQLAIKPEEISLGQQSDLQALVENIEEYGILDRSEKRGRARSQYRREEAGDISILH